MSKKLGPPFKGLHMSRILGALLFSLSFSLFAADNNEPQELSGNAALDDVAKLQNLAGDPKVREFAKDLCLTMMNAGETGKDIVQVMENDILGYMEITRETPEYQEKIISFWNANKNDFICKGKVTSKTRETEHLMKRAIALSLHDKVFDGFFFNTDEYDFDYNAIELVDGEPETVLDYLDKVISDPDASKKYVVENIIELRNSLRDEFGAMYAIQILSGESNN
jgi:hypothetical protein